jgi:HPt (histidine-containing phosphotransfer) domain-containing protein
MSNNSSVDFEKFKVETDLDDATLKELYQGFLEELLEEKEKILTQFQNKKFDSLAKTVHNIKGLTSSYMAVKAFAQSKELDLLLKNGTTENLEVSLHKLVDEIIETAGDIVNYYGL